MLWSVSLRCGPYLGLWAHNYKQGLLFANPCNLDIITVNHADYILVFVAAYVPISTSLGSWCCIEYAPSRIIDDVLTEGTAAMISLVLWAGVAIIAAIAHQCVVNTQLLHLILSAR